MNHTAPITDLLRLLKKNALSGAHPVGIWCHFAAGRIEQLERELAEAREKGMAWALAAQRCGLYRADVPHSTPEEWQSTQLSATTSRLDELVSAKADSKMWMDVAMARLVSVEHYHTESLSFQEQLTAHKAALEKCEKAFYRVIDLCEDDPSDRLNRPK